MKGNLERLLIGLKVNRVTEAMIVGDILFVSGWGLVTPILGIFFADQIIGGSVALAGLASAVFLVTKSILQVPIARYIDRKKGEWDDYWIMMVGNTIVAFSAFLYIFASVSWHIYFIQVLYGIGGAMVFPGWIAIFTRHMDKHREGSEWSLYSTMTGLAAALAGGLGGLLAARFGYKILFVLVGTATLVCTLILGGVARNIKKGNSQI